MTKKELRSIYRTRRSSLDPRTRMRDDDLMLIQFQQFDLIDVQSLLTYWPMPHAAEPNTQLYAGYLRHMVPQLATAYPRTDLSGNSMEAIAVDEETVYQANALGIFEPKDGDIVDPELLDMVFVPMLICDLHGNRVGFGKGYYDRFLARCREDVIKVGFSYFDPVEQIADTNEFDVPLSYCITPRAIYEF